MNNFCRLRGQGAIFSGLVPGPGVIWAEECCLLEYKRWFRVYALDWLVCIGMKGTVQDELFAISTHWLSPGGAVSHSSVRSQIPEHQEYRKQENVVVMD